jgi:hypothetical protein
MVRKPPSCTADTSNLGVARDQRTARPDRPLRLHQPLLQLAAVLGALAARACWQLPSCDQEVANHRAPSHGHRESDKRGEIDDA